MTPWDWLQRTADRWPDRPAYLWRDGTITYRRLRGLVSDRSRDLLRLGVQEGDRAILLLDNGPEFAVAFLAMLRVGAVMMCLNPAYHRHSLARLAQKVGAQWLVTTEACRETLAEVSGEIPGRVLLFGTDGDECGLGLEGKRPGDPGPLASGTVLLGPTSGSTGEPKLLMITGRQLEARVRHAVECLEIESDDILLGALPFLNGYGRDQVFLAAIRTGATVLLQDRFNPQAALRAAADGTLTMMIGVGLMFGAMLDLQEEVRFPRVRLCMAGAAFIPHIGQPFLDRFGQTLHNSYGAGEFSLAAINRDHDPESNWRAVGEPVSGCDIEIRPPDDPQGLSPGVGEIWVRSHRTDDGYLSAGYYLMPEETERHYRDGWAHAADLGRFDDRGRLEITGRTRNMVKFAGIQVSGEQIEQALKTHPLIADAAIVWDRNRWGEQARAVVEVKGPVIQQQLFEHCRRCLPPHMVPRQITVVKALPRTPTGKVDRLRLAGDDGRGEDDER